MRKYKYIDGGNFPYLDNLDIPDNAFDYSTWPVGTVIRVLHVPWDRDYSNVVKFDDDDARDKWIIEHTSTEYKLETAINIQPNGMLKLPIPFDVLGRSNFIAVSYAWAPVDYEQNPRVQTIGYFIDNVQQLAPSTTAAHITVDYWFTYINDLDISFMMLERGHAPVAATNANWFLEDPINRNELLTTPDVNFGPERARVKQAAEWVANDGNAYAVIACTGNVLSQYWGTKGTRTMETPGIASANWYGLAGGLDYFALRLADLNDFIVQCNAHRPHFLPTIQGLFLIPGKLLTFVQKFTWENFSMDMWTIDTNQKRYNLITLNKTAFDYPKPYRDLAKLYTAPYAHLEITDETGRVSRVDVENTSGHIDIDAALNLVHPFVGLDVMIIGNGDAGTITSTFGYGSDRTFQHGGDWYTTMHRYGIPSFIVSQSQNDRAQFNRFFPNAQAATARDNALTSALASNDTGKTNADASTNTANTNALASNDTGKTNADASTNTAFDNTARNISNSYDIAIEGNKVAWDDGASQIYVQGVAFNNHIVNDLITSINGSVNSIAGAATSGSAAAMGSAAIGTVTSIASYPLLFCNNKDIYDAAADAAHKHINRYYAVPSPTQGQEEGFGYYSTTHNRETANTNNTAAKTTGLDNNNRNKTTADINANRSKDTGLANNARLKSTADANANRAAATATAAIDNGNKAQGVEAPAVYAGTGNASTVASRPMGLFVNIVTQSRGAIKAAGDVFLRYGYALNQNWEVSKLQVMKYFTYWKASELWIGTRGQAIEDAADTVKRIFTTGTTIWDNPDNIGHISPLENLEV